MVDIPASDVISRTALGRSLTALLTAGVLVLPSSSSSSSASASSSSASSSSAVTVTNKNNKNKETHHHGSHWELNDFIDQRFCRLTSAEITSMRLYRYVLLRFVFGFLVLLFG
jgi:exo-beta-1,3-glucanase (GH17 family)